jgi:lipopolysaccharide transport system permease protein
VPFIIERRRGFSGFGAAELWRFRELLFFLVWRDVKVRYKQTALGAAWALLQPLLTTIVFSVFFGGMASVGSDGYPYPIFALTGVLPWNLFVHGLGESAGSIVASASLVKRVYFPRVIIPLAAVTVGLVDFAVTLFLLGGMMPLYGVPLAWRFAAIPLLAVWTSIAALAGGLWLSALNVTFRDVRYVIPFFLQLWLFVTPVIYPSTSAFAKLERLGIPSWLYGLNPMAGVVEAFRWVVLGHIPNLALLATGAVMTVTLLLGGAVYFRQMERSFADVV